MTPFLQKLSVLVFLLVGMYGLAAQAGAECDFNPDRVVVRFKHGSVSSIRPGAASGSLFEYSPRDRALWAKLSASGVTRMRKAHAQFVREQVRASDSRLIQLPVDMSDVYVLELPQGNAPDVIRILSGESDVVYAHPEYVVHALATTPNDPRFHSMWGMYNEGQYNSTAGVDIDAREAWDLWTGTGAAPVKVGVIDTGIDNTHPDFANVTMGPTYVTGTSNSYDDSEGHGTAIAGIIGAVGNNEIGIAGVDWNTNLVAIKALDNTGAGNSTDLGVAVNWARLNSIPIVNISCGHNPDSHTCDPDVDPFPGSLRDNLKNAHAAGMLTVTAMGNNNGNVVNYPAAFHNFTLATGAIWFFGHRWRDADVQICQGNNPVEGSNWGNWIDISGPGGRFITSTLPVAHGTYQEQSLPYNCSETFHGTSVAAAYVSGVAALVKSKAPILNGDDLEAALKGTAVDNLDNGLGWDQYTGAGMVNAANAIRLISAPNSIAQGTATGLYPGSVSSQFILTVFNFPDPDVHDGKVRATRHEMRYNLTFPRAYAGVPMAWARKSLSIGWRYHQDDTRDEDAEPVGWGEVIPGSITGSGCVLRTYVYEIRDYWSNAPIGWFPTTPSSASVAWTSIGTQQPLVSQSFFVPQVGSVGSPEEGTDATQDFHACPNNDNSSLPNNARVKIVLKDGSGNPLSNVSPDSIFVLFNGGTTAQGFSGAGADSVIANAQYSYGGNCPEVRKLVADAATDSLGATYVTFKGSTPGSPGVATRDPSRKWGHYDSELPIYALGVHLQGRLTSGGANGSYVLEIKNVDLESGLGANLNQGQVVSTTDFNSVTGHLNQADSADPKNWWRDLDSNGTVGTADLNMVTNHSNHSCTSPSP